MSEDRDPIFAPLTDGNYAEWEIRMEADLVEKGLWDYVFTEVVKPEGETSAAKILGRCGIRNEVKAGQG